MGRRKGITQDVSGVVAENIELKKTNDVLVESLIGIMELIRGGGYVTVEGKSSTLGKAHGEVVKCYTKARRAVMKKEVKNGKESNDGTGDEGASVGEVGKESAEKA